MSNSRYINEREDAIPDINGNSVFAFYERNDRDKMIAFTWMKQIYLEFSDLK